MMCKDCPNMACKVYYWQSETIKGYCMMHKKRVTGDTQCKENVQLELFT